MGEQAVAATVKLSRDPHIPTKLAAAQATGALLKAELDGHLPEGCAMEPLVPVLVALLGRDQNSEVQRQGLQVSLRGLTFCHLLQYTTTSPRLCTLKVVSANTVMLCHLTVISKSGTGRPALFAGCVNVAT